MCYVTVKEYQTPENFVNCFLNTLEFCFNYSYWSSKSKFNITFYEQFCNPVDLPLSCVTIKMLENDILEIPVHIFFIDTLMIFLHVFMKMISMTYFEFSTDGIRIYNSRSN